MLWHYNRSMLTSIIHMVDETRLYETGVDEMGGEPTSFQVKYIHVHTEDEPQNSR